MKYDITIYTDGAYSRVHDEGAFAFVMLDQDLKEIKRFAKKVTKETNNRTELKAIIAAIYLAPKTAQTIKVISDSQYALNTLFGTWARNANKDLFEVFDRIVAGNNFAIDYEWVKGHSGNKWNEICDTMCNAVLGYDANEEFKKYKKYKPNS